MKTLWSQLAARVNALSARERVILFFSLLLAMLALIDALWLTPMQNAQRQLAQKFSSQGAELDRLRTELMIIGQAKNSNQAVRDDIAKAQQHIDSINDEINQYVPVSSGGPALDHVLVEFLRKQNGLTLLSTTTLKDESMMQALAGAVLAASTGGLMRRGLELRVAGPYNELTRYVKTLETALPNLRWGAMQLKVNKQVPELTLTVYVLGVRS